MKIFIAVPTFESIFPDTYKSIYGLDPAGHRLVFDFVRGYDCAAARNRIAQQARAEQADYVFMVDNDVVLPPDALKNLLEEPADVCLGYYAHRDADNVYRGRTCLCRTHKNDGTPYFHYPTESEYTGAELRTMRDSGVNKILIHGGGMGWSTPTSPGCSTRTATASARTFISASSAGSAASRSARTPAWAADT